VGIYPSPDKLVLLLLKVVTKRNTLQVSSKLRECGTLLLGLHLETGAVKVLRSKEPTTISAQLNM
jgi:hypothetical protein